MIDKQAMPPQPLPANNGNVSANMATPDNQDANATGAPAINHASPSTEGKTAAEYTFEAMKLHQEQYKNQGKPPTGLLKWIGDASLAVPPINRMYSAIGLTTGLMIAGSLANIATGYKLLDGKPVEKVPTFLKGLQGIVKNYDPQGMDTRNKFIKYGQTAIYSLGGLLGVKVGTDMAYKKNVERAKNPQYLEDYLTSVSHIQGKTWSWLSATSGIWGSASGAWLLPIPGVNYATGMIGRVTTMQDRNTMVGGLNKITSGATTTSYLRLKEGVHYTAHYAVGNPAQDPTQLEYLAYTVLGPLFKDKLTAEHIKQFTDTIHAVRAHYWQEGGIPKAKRKEAVETMKQVITGAGLEVLLIDMGLNPATVAFDQVNGLIGKIGDIGQMKEIHDKQNAFWKALQERLPKYVAAGIISQERADWVVEGIEDMRKGKRQETPAPDLEIAAEPDTLERSKTVADILDAKPKLSSIDTLVKSAQRQGDWRQEVLKQKQEMDSPRITSD